MTLFRLLGPLEVEHDDGPIALGGERARALLTALLLQPNSLVPAYRLIEVLWPNATLDNPENAFAPGRGPVAQPARPAWPVPGDPTPRLPHRGGAKPD